MFDEHPTSFGIQDVLISRTDGRGVILGANTTFQRVSGYPWDELKGAPHKIIRHPDMPRAVFHLIWETLKRGEPISAFVKNRTKNGGHYWVFANIVPAGDGYLSVRIKPDPDLVAEISEIYADVRKAELDEKLAPDESLALLSEKLQDRGHPGYWDFMSRTGAEQWIKRNRDCGKPNDDELERLFAIQTDWDAVRKICSDVLIRHDAFETSPLNLRIQAAQLGDNGRALDIIASSFTDLARRIRDSMSQFSNRVELVSSAVRRGTYLVCVDRLLEEARAVLEVQSVDDSTDHHDLDLITEQCVKMRATSREWVSDVTREFDAFASDLWLTKRNLTGLSLTRVMSAIENAQIRSTSVMSIIDELRAFQEFSDVSLRNVQKGITAMQGKL